MGISKIYFAIKEVLIRIKSLFFSLYFRLWGLKIEKYSLFRGKPRLEGYLNNIKIRKKCMFDRNVKLLVNKEGVISIGENVLISNNVIINAGVGKIIIGNNVMIAANSYIINNDHSIYDNLSPKLSGHITKDVEVQENVWIGANVVILKGVTINEGAVIGAGSVVTKNVMPYCVYAGNPCRFIKKRFDDDELEKKLLEYKYDRKKIKDILKKRNMVVKNE